MKEFFLKLSKIADYFIRASILIIIFLIPLYFGFIFDTANLFELNKIILFKLLVLFILFCALIRFYINKGVIGKIIEIRKVKGQESALSAIKNILSGKYLFISVPLLFFGSYGISTFLSLDPGQSFYGLYDRQQGLTTIFFCVMFYLLLLLNIKTLGQAKKIISAAALSGLVAGIYGLAQKYGYDFMDWSESYADVGRIMSAMGQPNFFASWLLFVLPLDIYLVITTKKYYYKIFWGVAFLICFYNLFYTYSFGGWLGFIAGVAAVLAVCILFYRKKIWAKKKIIAYIGTVTLAIASVAGLYYFSTGENYLLKAKINELKNTDTGSIGARLDFWQAGVKELKSIPFFGYGPETQAEILVKYYEPDWAIHTAVNARPNRFHNFFLDTVIITGWPGLAANLFLIGWFYFISLKNIKRGSNSLLYLCLIFGFTAYLTSLMVSFHFIAGLVYFWLFLALAVVLDRNQKAEATSAPDNGEEEPSRYWKLAVLLIGGVLLIYAGRGYLIILIADHYYLGMKIAYVNFTPGDLGTMNLLHDYIQERGVRMDYYNESFVNLTGDLIDHRYDAAYQDEILNKMELFLPGFTGDTYRDRYTRAKICRFLAAKDNSFYVAQAEEEFKKLIAYSPETPGNYFQLGKLYETTKRYEEAESMIGQAAAKLPDPARPDVNPKHGSEIKSELFNYYATIGDLYFTAKKYDTAENFYWLMDKSMPGTANYYRIGLTFQMRQKWDEAEKYFLIGAKGNEKDFRWPLALMRMYEEEGDKEKAKEYAGKVLALYPNHGEAKRILGE